MFAHKLTELVSMIFGIPANIDRNETHSANEIYIKLDSEYDVSVTEGDGVYFNVPCTLSVTFSPSDNDAYGFLTTSLLNYKKIPKNETGKVSSLKSFDDVERVSVQTANKTRIEKQVTFSVYMDYDKVSEVIKGIKYKGVNNG